MEVNLGLLDVDQLTWFGGEDCNNDWQDLRYTKSNIGDAYKILRSWQMQPIVESKL